MVQEEFPGTEETKEDMDDAIDPMLAQNQGDDDSVPDEDLPMTYVESGDMDLVNPRESQKDINKQLLDEEREFDHDEFLKNS